MHRHFATVSSRIMQFSPKCSEKFFVYQSMQNLYQLVKCSLTNCQNWITYYERRHPACDHDASDKLKIDC